MIEKKKLPFDYFTFAIAYSTITHARKRFPETVDKILDNYPIEEVTKHINSISKGNETSEAALRAAFTLLRNNANVYHQPSALEYQINALIKSEDYFPENINDYIQDSGSEELACYHEDLMSFWKTYTTHLYAREAISSMATLYGVMRINPTNDISPYPCLYHRGMNKDNIPPVIKSIVEMYDAVEEILGFSPAYFPPSPELIDNRINDFIVNVDEEGKILEVSLTTLVGRIWLAGVPPRGVIGGVKFEEC